MRTLIGATALAVLGIFGAEKARETVPLVGPELAAVSAIVAQALERGEDADMVRAYLDVVTGSNPVVCNLTLRGMGNGWGGYSSMTTVTGFGVPQDEERQLLEWVGEGRLDDAAARPLADALSHGDECRRQVAAALFRRVEDDVALSVLEPLAEGGNTVARIAALRALGHVEARSSSPLLLRALEDGDGDVRRVAAWSLGRLEDPETVSALSGALAGDRDAGVRGNAAWALGRIEHPSAIVALSEALQDDAESPVRVNAAWALGQIEDPDGIPALTRALGGDADPLVRKAAAWALGQMS